MNEIEYYENFLYINKNKGAIYFLVSIVIAFFISLSLFDFSIIGNYIMCILYIIISFCVLLLIKSTLNEESMKLLKLVSIPFLIIAISNIFMLLPGKLIVKDGELYKLLSNIIDNHTFYSFLIVTSVLMAIRYINLGKSNIIITSIKIIGVLGCCIFLNIIGYEWLISSVLNLSYCFSCFISFKYIKNYKLIKQDKINYLYIVLVLISFSSLVFVICKNININNSTLCTFIGIIDFITFFIYSTSIIDKLINRPYKMLFSDLYEKNIEMNETNKKIVAKNRELEFSQVILKKKEKMLRTLFRNVPVPLVIINSTNDRIIYSNSNFLELIGIQRLSDVINKKLFSLIKVNDDADLRDFSENYKNRTFRGEIELNGKIKYIDLAFIDNASGYEEAMVIFNDVTNKVAVDKIRETMSNKMMEEKLKSDFLSNISHDLKTPINVIYSATQLNDMFIEQKNTEGLKKYNIISKHNCLLLTKLTNNLIDSSKIFSDFLSVNMKRKNIVEVVEDTITGLAEYTKGKDIELIFDTNEEEIYIMLDEDFMQRILLNTLSNAIKFTPNGGKIEVVVEDTEEEEVKVYIRDNGVGMESDFLDNAFSRYAMGKNNDKSKEKGTGIGLFVVKKLVEKQKGSINIISKLGEGTCIELTFTKGYDYEY